MRIFFRLIVDNVGIFFSGRLSRSKIILSFSTHSTLSTFSTHHRFTYSTEPYQCSSVVMLSSSLPQVTPFCFLRRKKQSSRLEKALQSESRDCLSKKPILKKQESYIKDTTDFVRFIENTPIPDNAIIGTLDVCSLYNNIPQEERIKVV